MRTLFEVKNARTFAPVIVESRPLSFLAYTAITIFPKCQIKMQLISAGIAQEYLIMAGKCLIIGSFDHYVIQRTCLRLRNLTIICKMTALSSYKSYSVGPTLFHVYILMNQYNV